MSSDYVVTPPLKHKLNNRCQTLTKETFTSLKADLMSLKKHETGDTRLMFQREKKRELCVSGKWLC